MKDLDQALMNLRAAASERSQWERAVESAESLHCRCGADRERLPEFRQALIDADNRLRLAACEYARALWGAP